MLRPTSGQILIMWECVHILIQDQIATTKYNLFSACVIRYVWISRLYYCSHCIPKHLLSILDNGIVKDINF